MARERRKRGRTQLCLGTAALLIGACMLCAWAWIVNTPRGAFPGDIALLVCVAVCGVGLCVTGLFMLTASKMFT